MMPAGYLIRRIRSGWYEISKWGDSTEPEAVYLLRETRKGWKCSSPGCGRKLNCKHSQILQKWLLKKIMNNVMPEKMLKESGEEF